MSLINDALKRAKEAQTQQPSPPLPGAPLHPAQTAARTNLWVLLLVPAVVAACVVAGALILWSALKPQSSPPQPAAVVAQSAADAPEALPVFAAQEESALATLSPPPATAQSPQTVTASATAVVELAVADDPAERALLLEAPEEGVVALASETVEIAPHAPPPLRLQGIFYNPANPSVLINGNTLFIGDQIGDARVVAITMESVTLVSDGQTNVLSVR